MHCAVFVGKILFLLLVKFYIGVGVTLTNKNSKRITDKFLYFIGQFPRVSVAKQNY